jgi:hypothetical protein
MVGLAPEASQRRAEDYPIAAICKVLGQIDISRDGVGGLCESVPEKGFERTRTLKSPSRNAVTLLPTLDEIRQLFFGFGEGTPYAAFR